MKKLIDIALLKVKITLKDKTALAWMFIAPLIFIIILVWGFGSGDKSEGNYPITITNVDKGYYSEELITMLKKDKAFEVTECDYEKAKKIVEDGNAAMGIIIPNGFSNSIEKEEKIQIELLKLQNNESTASITTVINNYISQINIKYKAKDAVASILYGIENIDNKERIDGKKVMETSLLNNMNSPKIKYSIKSTTENEKKNIDSLSYSSLGILVMFIGLFLSGDSGAILEEKDINTWYRIKSTPTKQYSFLGGHVLGNFILGWIQVGLLIIISRYIFNINWGNSILGLFILFSTFILSIIGLGTFLASLVDSKAQLSALSPITTMPASLLAGCMWPIEIMPDIMITISNFVPQRWVIKGMTDLISRGGTISSIYIPSAVLLLFAVIFFILGLTVNQLKIENV